MPPLGPHPRPGSPEYRAAVRPRKRRLPRDVSAPAGPRGPVGRAPRQRHGGIQLPRAQGGPRTPTTTTPGALLGIPSKQRLNVTGRRPTARKPLRNVRGYTLPRTRGQAQQTLDTLAGQAFKGHPDPYLLRVIPRSQRKRVAREVLKIHEQGALSGAFGHSPPEEFRHYAPRQYAKVQGALKVAAEGRAERTGSTDVGLFNPINIAVDLAALPFGGPIATRLARGGLEAGRGLAVKGGLRAVAGARGAAALARSPEARRAAGRLVASEFRTAPAKTGFRAATGPVGALGATHVTQLGPAAAEFTKAQLDAFRHAPRRYTQRTGAFIPGTIGGLVTLGGNVGYGIAAGKPKAIAEAGKSLVLSQKEFLGYLSPDPKVQKQLAEKYGAGPFVIAGLPLRGRRARGEVKFGGYRSRSRMRFRTSRDISRIKGWHENLGAEAVRYLERPTRKVRNARTGKVVKTVRNPYHDLPSDIHRDAAFLVSEGNVSTHVPRKAEEQLKAIVERDPEAAKQPGSEAHVANWLLGQLRQSKGNYIRESGLAAAARHIHQAERIAAPSEGLIGRTEQRVAANRLLGAQHGITEPELRVPGHPDKTREGLRAEAKAHLRRAETLKHEAREALGAAKASKTRKRFYQDKAERLKAQEKADRTLAKQKIRAASEKLNLPTPAQQHAFLREVGQVRAAESLPVGGRLRHEDIRKVLDQGEQHLVEQPRFSRLGTRMRLRKGTVQESGYKALSAEHAVRASFIRPLHQSALVDIARGFSDRWRQSLSRDQLSRAEKAGLKLKQGDPLDSFTLPQIRAIEEAGIYDPKDWVALPLDRVTKDIARDTTKGRTDTAGAIGEVGSILGEGGLVGTATRSYGQRFQIVPREAAAEWHHQMAGTSGVYENFLRGFRHFNRYQALAVLSTSLGWVPMQVLAEGIPTAITTNPLKWRKYLQTFSRLTPRERALFQSSFGGTYGFGQVLRPFERGETKFRPADELEASKIGARTYAGRLVRGQANPIEALQRLDAWKGVKFRQIKGMSAADRLITNRMLKTHGETWKLTDEAIRKLKAAKAESPEAMVREMSKHPALMDEIDAHVRDVLGDWVTLTSKEALPAALGFFYPMLRYTTRFVFHSFPARHPLLATVVNLLGQANTQEVRRLLGGDDPPFLQALMQGVLYTGKEPRPINVARATPGGQALVQSGVQGLTLQSVLGLAQPIAGIAAGALAGTDPFTGQPVLPEGGLIGSSGQIIRPSAGTAATGLDLKTKGKIAAGALLRLPSGIRLAESVFLNPRPEAGQLPIPGLDRPRRFNRSPASDFYKLALPSAGQKALGSVLPPVFSTPFPKQRALNIYGQARLESQLGGQQNYRTQFRAAQGPGTPGGRRVTPEERRELMKLLQIGRRGQRTRTRIEGGARRGSLPPAPKRKLIR